jgi:hypothetical protein
MLDLGQVSAAFLGYDARMTHRLLRFAAGIVASAPLLCALADAQPAPVALFNGKDLSGWSYFLAEPKAALADVWSVKDGAITCKSGPVGYLYTNAEFTNYTLTVEWRYPAGTAARIGTVPNSGVFVRINGEPKPKGIPRTYEIQMQVGHAGDVMGFWGMPLEGDSSRRRETKASPLVGDMVGFQYSEGAEKPEGEWNSYEITVDGGTITVRLNGKTVNQVTGAAVVPGHVGLQSEGADVQFRRVELRPIAKQGR